MGRTTYAQQKLPSSLYNQDKCFSAMNNFFLYCGSYLPFEIFRSNPLVQMIHSASGENDIRALTMPNLKKLINAEWSTYVKFIQKESYDHHVENIFNEFCQFINDGFDLKIK